MIGNSVNAPAPPPSPPSVAGVQIDHLSWSGIKCYTDCPRKFHYRYIAQVPAEFVPASLAFGSAIHAAAQLCHQARLEGQVIPDVAGLAITYDGAWRAETVHAPEVLYPKNEDAVSLREMATRMLTTYREHVTAAAMRQPAQIIGVEHAHRFHLLSDVPSIEMRLDLLELVGPDLIVTDIKTSRSRWNDEKAREHLPQLVLYSVGLVPLLRDLGAKRIIPRFCVITKAKTPAIQVLEPKASQQDVDRLKRMTSETWDAVQKDVFVQREGWGCAQCPYRTRCLGR
ncbi:MAG TPA: PD-(D/E)XK nuclease family protein [Planctomycetota bacterium]|jgi:CRISPR/Cas system-associated exonuclease Cas4 (RecB family)